MSFSSNTKSSKCFIVFGSDASSPCTYCEYTKALLENMPYDFLYVAVNLRHPADRASFASMLKSYHFLVGDSISIPQIFCITEEEYSMLKSYPLNKVLEHLGSHTNRKYVGGFENLVAFVHAEHGG